jgi:hypothetical protein
VTTPAAASPAQHTGISVADNMNSDLGAIHDQILALAGAVPVLPHEFDHAADRVTAIDADSGNGQLFLDLGIFGDPYRVATRHLAAETQALLNLVLFGAIGFGAQWLFRKMTARLRRRLDGLPMATVKDRLRVIAVRFALAFGVIAAFVLGSITPLLILDMDPIRRETLLSFLIVFAAIWLAVATGDFLLAPDNERFRIVPTDTAAAQFWRRRLVAFAGWLAFVWVIIQECDSFGFSFEEPSSSATLSAWVSLRSHWKRFGADPLPPARSPKQPQPRRTASGGARPTSRYRSAS